jgi:adenylate cyclase class 2
MFDNPQNLMQITNGRVRVRYVGEQGEKILTYKRPIKSKNGAKREIEYEIEFKDKSEQTENILKLMEFSPVSSYERFQTKWQIGGVKVTLDEYPYANFIEIEGAFSKIKKLTQDLGFKIKESLTKPVDTLFKEWRESKGLPFKAHMKFDDFNK